MRKVTIQGFEYTLPEDPTKTLGSYTPVRDLSKDVKEVPDILTENGGEVHAVGFSRVMGLINLMSDEIDRLRDKEALWLEPTQAMVDAGIKELLELHPALELLHKDELSDMVVFTLQAIASKRHEKAQP